ncbi:MAG: aminotransferase class IV, partial [Cytophagales bacterium]|nr:aminotransferase class IV [Cytophagales bacterium]
MHVCYNFSIIDKDEFSLPIYDRAFQYGDGLFETMIYKNNQIRWLDDHWQRLMSGCDTLRFQLPTNFTLNSIALHVKKLIELNHHSLPVKIKLIVWRSSGGLFTPTNNQIHFVILTDDQIQTSGPINTLGISERVTLFPSLLSSIKSISSLPYILAGIEKKERELDELIITDVQGNISEGTSSNIFWTIGNKFYTPALSTGCLPGVTRKKLIEHLQKMGSEVQEISSRKDSLS